jgi:hypothetical protein
MCHQPMFLSPVTIIEGADTERYKKCSNENCLGYDKKYSLVHIDTHVSPFNSTLFSVS